jgi:glucosamine--fructose-6-phosphate aminotransferase (isomerizing)
VCGIVGYTGPRRALPWLLDGLAALEYRGYDSAGVALVSGAGVVVVKAVGRLEQLRVAAAGIGAVETCGIGHTRWATHGPPTAENAHPHRDCHGQVAAVHNGIIENYRGLRSALEARGHRFRSDTDTEVIPHLFEEALAAGLAPLAAAQAVARQLEGAYAFVAVAARYPTTLVAVREASPLIVGTTPDTTYIASDVTALLPYTRDVLVLENGDALVAEPGRVTVVDRHGRTAARVPLHVTWTAEQASKGGFPHFMLKEMHEQPEVWADCLRERLRPDGTVDAEALGVPAAALTAVERVHIVGAGTAFHAGLVGRRLVERWAAVPATVEVASEFRYNPPVFERGAVVWAVSQSGETADTLASVRAAKEAGYPIWAITNVVGSTLAREADHVMYIRAGPEIAVASTKAFTTQLLVLTLLAHALAATRGRHAADARTLETLPALAARWLVEAAPATRPVSERLASAEHVFYLGRGLDYPLALEGQLKLKEIAYVHAEAYPAGELKHGPLALIERGTPVVVVATDDRVMAKTLSNVEEVRARGAWVAIVGPEDDLAARGAADAFVPVPRRAPELMPALTALPLQWMAYEAAAARGLDVDRPRNLAKSVTVE